MVVDCGRSRGKVLWIVVGFLVCMVVGVFVLIVGWFPGLDAWGCELYVLGVYLVADCFE